MSGRSIAVIPTVSPDTASLIGLASSLRGRDVDVRIVTNSVRARKIVSSVPYLAELMVDNGKNNGFAGSVDLALDEEVESWDWLVIVNDDVVVPGSEENLVTPWLDADCDLIFLCPEPWRPVPSSLDVFINLSLTTKIFRRPRRAERASSDLYQSFSFVAIRRSLWHSLSGFDPRYVFTFEDADFVRRARNQGARFCESAALGARHLHSVSSSTFIDSVLPASSWSALQFLAASGRSTLFAKSVVVFGLLVRCMLVPLSRANLVAHYRGVWRSVLAVGLGKPPQLPTYGEIR